MGTIFFDLDKTLVSLDGKADKYDVDGDSYAFMHGGRELLLALNSMPGMSINFFSFGTERRNRQLVGKLVQDLGLKPYRVFSQDHLHCVDSFTVYKRLENLLPGDLDMEQTIIVDDMAYSVSAQGEERNFLPVYTGEFQFGGSPGTSYAAGVFRVRRDNNLVRVLGMILWCLKTSVRNKVSLVDALTALQWDSTTSTYRHTETNSKAIYDIGLAAMRRFSPEFELLDEEHKGFLPWLPSLAALNPGMEVRVLVSYQHFGFDKEQVRRIVEHSWNEIPTVRNELRDDAVSVEVQEGLNVHLPAGLSVEATKEVVKDIVKYSFDGNTEVLVEKSPGKYKLVLRCLRLCDLP